MYKNKHNYIYWIILILYNIIFINFLIVKCVGALRITQ